MMSKAVSAVNTCLPTTLVLKLTPHLGDSGQGAVGSVGPLLVREPPAAETVHGVGGDGVAELLEGVIPVPALFDLMEQFGQLTRHSII